MELSKKINKQQQWLLFIKEFIGPRLQDGGLTVGRKNDNSKLKARSQLKQIFKSTFVGPMPDTRDDYQKKKEFKQTFIGPLQKKAFRGQVYKDLSPEKKAEQIMRVLRRQDRFKYATPSWANKDKIKEIYTQAQTLTRDTGIQHEVDHIIPLQGKLVSGLHVEDNLQILTRKENRAKHNRY